MLQLMCLCWHLIALHPPLLFPCSGCRGRPSVMAPCVVLICSEGSEGCHQRCTGRSRCCWSCWHILLGCSSTLYYQASSSVASNQYSVLSGQASFFFINPIMHCKCYVHEENSWRPLDISALWQLLCFILQTLSYDWPVGSWQTILCWTVTTVMRPNPSAGHYSWGFGSSGNPTREVI